MFITFVLDTDNKDNTDNIHHNNYECIYFFFFIIINFYYLNVNGFVL